MEIVYEDIWASECCKEVHNRRDVEYVLLSYLFVSNMDG